MRRYPFSAESSAREFVILLSTRTQSEFRDGRSAAACFYLTRESRGTLSISMIILLGVISKRKGRGSFLKSGTVSVI